MMWKGLLHEMQASGRFPWREAIVLWHFVHLGLVVGVWDTEGEGGGRGPGAGEEGEGETVEAGGGG